MSDLQSIAVEDPSLVLELAKQNPEALLLWVYDNLGLPEDQAVDPDWVEAIRRGASSADPTEFYYALQLKRYPVSVEKFLFDAYYLGKKRTEIFPEVLRELQLINNPGGTRIVNRYTELVATGGIGSAKSTTSLYTVAYQLYVLSCFLSPHETFGLDTASEIVFVFIGMSGDSAATDYERFYAMLQHSPYFTSDFPYRPNLKSEMHFPHRIQVKTEMTAIGQNVMGGLIDEVNHGLIIQNSKRAFDGGVYNATVSTYDSLSRRRKSRFQAGGRAPGIFCLVGSKRYPGEFTDTKLEEAKTDPSIYVYDKRVWDIKPPGTFSKQTFQVFPGSLEAKPRIITPEEPAMPFEVGSLVNIPMDFKREFTTDLIGSLRDIAGIGTISRYPYFQDLNSVSQSFGKVPSILSQQVCDLETVRLEFYPKRFREIKRKRWVHVDLGMTADAAGVACGYVPEFVESVDEAGMMPRIELDFILRVPPPKAGEIRFSKIRKLIIALRQAGLPIEWVSFDSFQSADSIQILRQLGFSTGVVSMDKQTQPYAVTKTAFYSGRVWAPEHAHCVKEFASLEKDAKTGKIDHPAAGSKDCADAVAGVIYGLTTSRYVWADHGVPINISVAASTEVKTKSEAN